MKSSLLYALGFTTAAVSASVLPRDDKKVQWAPCPATFNSTAPIECGSLAVPLDYSDPNSTKTLELKLLRLPASKKPSKGSILFNFGGPGEPGRAYMAETGAGIQE